jgi:citronellol/citronellal dehydrogenase
MDSVTETMSGKVCMVTGATSGIGKETARELVRMGARVVIVSSSQVRCAAVVEEFRKESRNQKVDYLVADLSSQAEIHRLASDFQRRYDRLDVLVNNAGGQFLAPAEAISAKGFRTVTELNVQGTWNMTHAAATRAFIPQERGKVISITLSPHNGMPGMVHSGAARAAVENMMRGLSIEWSRFGIRCVAVAPGQIGTETLMTKYPREMVETMDSTIPLGRLGRPEEVAWLIAYLASPAGDFFSGTTVTVDGGRDNWFGSWPPALGTRDGEPLSEERRPKA